MRPHLLVVRANGVFLLAASAFGLATDVAGAFFGIGGLASVLTEAPHAAIGFFEAHALAFIFGTMLMRAQPALLWHQSAALVHLALGAANIIFWQIFVATDLLAMGYATTALHAVFVIAQTLMAITSKTEANRSATLAG